MSGYTQKFLDLLKECEDIPDYQPHLYKGLQALGQYERILNLYRIEDKNTGAYKFFGDVINPEQQSFIENQTGRDLILKARQIGMTGLQIILGLDEALFVPGTRAGIMAHTKEKAVASIFDRLRKTWEWFQKDWGDKIPVKSGTESSCQLDFPEVGSSLMVGFDFRSVKLNRLHISESAFIVDDERITASQQAVPPPPHGKVSHETTPRGRAGWFFDNWTAGKKYDSVWKLHFFKWWDHYPESWHKFENKKYDWDDREKELISVYNVPERALLWRRWKIQESYRNEPEKFEVDYPTDERDCFVGGYGIIPRSLLLKIEKRITEPVFRGELVEDQGIIKPVPTKDGPVYIWEFPKPGNEYCGGIDSAEGRGGRHDWAACVLKNRMNKKQVALIHSNTIPPDALARYAFLLGTFYNKAWWCPERNSCGGEVVRQLDSMGYGPIYMAKADQVDRVSDSRQLGFYMGSNKDHVVLQFLSRLRAGSIIPNSQAWFDEMTNFGRDDQGRLNALAGHDDIFIAGCLCEEMDKTLGELEVELEPEYDRTQIDPATGFPL